eukprot:scaffold69445_cov18-Tisochrysis_lutea.AAC.1
MSIHNTRVPGKLFVQQRQHLKIFSTVRWVMAYSKRCEHKYRGKSSALDFNPLTTWLNLIASTTLQPGTVQEAGCSSWSECSSIKTGANPGRHEGQSKELDTALRETDY